MFLAYYVAYTAYLVMTATQHASLAVYQDAMLGFVIPLTIVTLIVVLVRAVSSARTENSNAT